MYRSHPERTYPPRWRVVAAFLIVPALAALACAAAMPAYAGLPTLAERIWKTAVLYCFFGAYPLAALFGIPSYFALRRHFDPLIINCALVGAIIAAGPWMFLLLVSPPNQASIDGRATVVNGSYTAFGWLENAQFLGQIALAGALGGALFWAIAAAGSGAGKVR